MRWIPFIGIFTTKGKTVGEMEKEDNYFWLWMIYQWWTSTVIVAVVF
jgi:hypothetical protein